MSDFLYHISAQSSSTTNAARVKQEPIEPADDAPFLMPEDEYEAEAYNQAFGGAEPHDDTDDDNGHDPDPDPDPDPDIDYDDKRAVTRRAPVYAATSSVATTAAAAARLGSTSESAVRHVTLTPTRAPKTVDARASLPHQNKVFNLNAYDEPLHIANIGDGAQSTSTQAASIFCNYVTARWQTGGAPVRLLNSRGFESVMIKAMLSAPPHLSVPASDGPAASARLDLVILEYDQFVELCSTARPGEPRCVRGPQDCEALTIENKNGKRINDAPFVAHWFKHELPKKNGPDAETFRRDWAQRMCIWCEAIAAARFFHTSASTNTPANAHEKTKAFVGWCVMVEREGEFVAHQTIGPDRKCFNGLVGNVPRPTRVGWSFRGSTQTARVEFQPPHTCYKAPVIDPRAADGARGF